MEPNNKPKFPKAKDHLNKTFLEDLGHKMWNTKGTRFCASERLITIHNLSIRAQTFMSAYLIIFGLISVYQISGEEVLSANIIAFSSTALSILLLAFTLLEGSQEYKTRALEFQKCSLEISNLHEHLRLFKTLTEPSKEAIVKFCEETQEKYNKIIASYPNHSPIDYKLFKSRHADYYEISKRKVFLTKVDHYYSVKLLYHLIIVAPPIAFLIFKTLY